MNPVYGYRNAIEQHQTPKPEHGLRGKSSVETKSMTDTLSSKYEWNQCFKRGAGWGERFEVDERPAWRCPDCGREREPSSDEWECCSRCGSVAEPTWR